MIKNICASEMISRPNQLILLLDWFGSWFLSCISQKHHHISHSSCTRFNETELKRPTSPLLSLHYSLVPVSTSHCAWMEENEKKVEEEEEERSDLLVCGSGSRRGGRGVVVLITLKSCSGNWRWSQVAQLDQLSSSSPSCSCSSS